MTFLRRRLKHGERPVAPGLRLSNAVATDPEGPWPRWVQLGDDSSVTAQTETLGTIDSGPVATIDDRGLAGWIDGRFSVDWWIRTGEGWRYPSRTRKVRQVVGAVPVIETSFAMANGEILATAFVAQSSKGPVLAIDFVNDSSTPIALALAIRPIDSEGLGIIEHVKVYDNTVSIDGAVLLVADRSPSASVAVADFVSLPPAVERASSGQAVEATSDLGTAQAAMIFPMLEQVRLSVVVGADVAPAEAGRRVAVENGWLTHLDRLLQVEVEGMEVDAELALAIRRLVTTVRGGRVVRTRAGIGQWSLVDDLCIADALLEIGDAHSAAEIVLDALDPDRLLAAEAVERDVAMNSFVRLWQHTRRPEILAAARESLEVPDEVLIQITPAAALSTASSWPVVNAVAALKTRRCFVSERGGELHMLDGFEPAWRGQKIDVRNARTAFGRLSYSLRWHGERPALLWDLDVDADAMNFSEPAAIRVPALDVEWRTDQMAGEALLAAQPV